MFVAAARREIEIDFCLCLGEDSLEQRILSKGGKRTRKTHLGVLVSISGKTALENRIRLCLPCKQHRAEKALDRSTGRALPSGCRNSPRQHRSQLLFDLSAPAVHRELTAVFRMEQFRGRRRGECLPNPPVTLVGVDECQLDARAVTGIPGSERVCLR